VRKRWLAVVAVAATGWSAPAAQAQIPATTSATQLALAMLESPSVLTGAEFEEKPAGDSAAVVTSELAGFPTHGGSAALLSTGDVGVVTQPNTASDTGTDFGGGGVRGGEEHDVTVLRLDVNVPAGVNCLANLDFRFLSEEYPEYVGSAYNDAFIAELDESTWQVSGSAIVAPGNFAFDPAGNPITVNAAGVTSMTAEEAAGTTFDGATPHLRAATPITPGPHRIYLSLFDVGDGIYDSAVMIDGIRFARVANVSRDCKPGAEIVDTRDYVALGDSFSSGYGNAPYAPGTHKDNGPNDCQRSTTAYPHVVANRYGLDLAFRACQGAVTKDFYSPRNQTWGEPAQLDHLSESTGLVTFSIGGNDAHFATVVRDCIDGWELLPFNNCHSDERIWKPVTEALDRLAGKTATPVDTRPYERIFKDVRAKAPYSTRVVVGYPEFFPENGGDRTFLPGGRCEGIKKADQRWMVEQIRKLNGIIQDAARRTGFRYAEPMEFFDGHQLCSGGTEWIGGVLAGNRFHPTVAGQNGLGQAVIAALDDAGAEGGAYTVAPGATVTGSFTVALGQALLSIIAQWPGSDVPLTLISPSGTEHSREDPGPGVTHDVGPTWEQFEIPNPEPGEWTFKLFGKDVSPAGEPVTVLPTTTPPDNVAPTARISYGENPDGTLTFSSAQSSDPDGRIVRREWYVTSGGAAERYAEGETVTVARSHEGGNATLVVTDDRGDTSFAEAIIPATPAGQGPPPVESPKDQPLQPVVDRRAPRITKVTLQKAVKQRRKTVWKRTKTLAGKVRVRMTLSEPATVTVKLASARKPTKPRSRTVRVKRAGVATIDITRLAKGLRRGKVKLSISAKDATGNVSTKTLSTRR
jgi:lysophospholipase L1-like esterase